MAEFESKPSLETPVSSQLHFVYRGERVSVPIAVSREDLASLIEKRLFPIMANLQNAIEGEIGIAAYRVDYMYDRAAFIESSGMKELLEALEPHHKPKRPPTYEQYPTHSNLISERRKNANAYLEGGWILGPFSQQTYLIGPMVVGKMPDRPEGPSSSEDTAASTLVISGSFAIDTQVLLQGDNEVPQRMTNKEFVEILEGILTSSRQD